MKLSETAYKLIAEFRNAVVDFNHEPCTDTLYKLTAKRQALENYIFKLETMTAKKKQKK